MPNVLTAAVLRRLNDRYARVHCHDAGFNVVVDSVTGDVYAPAEARALHPDLDAWIDDPGARSFASASSYLFHIADRRRQERAR